MTTNVIRARLGIEPRTSPTLRENYTTKPSSLILLYLQSPPTKSWTDSDIELLLSEAYLLQSLFKNAPNLFS